LEITLSRRDPLGADEEIVEPDEDRCIVRLGRGPDTE
jgi:hypothetical protein